MVPLLEQARDLRDKCRIFDSETIERPEGRASFNVLFRDVHAFSRGVGNPSRVVALAQGFAGHAGLSASSCKGDGGLGRAGLLQEEEVWQGAAGAFVSRFRADYGEAYTDVVTGICDAVGILRVGMRMLAAASSGSGVGGEDGGAGGDSPRLVKLQGFLLGFPYSCSDVGMGGLGSGDDHLQEALELSFNPVARSGKKSASGGKGEGTSPAHHMTVLQVRFSGVYTDS